MKKLIEKIKYLWNLPKSLKEAEEDIENLEKKLLAPEVVGNVWSTYLSSLNWGFGGTEYRGISLEEKVDALGKYLKVNFEHIETDEVVAKKIKKKK